MQVSSTFHSTKNAKNSENGSNGTEMFKGGGGEFPENPEIVVFPKSEPSNQKFQAENQMKQLYLERLLSFVEILENA